MTHYLHYHKWDLVLKRIKLTKGNFDPFDKIGSDKKMPEDIVESTVWGITKRDKEWFFTGRLDVKWSGSRENLPEGTSRPKLQGLDYYASCPESEAMGHGLYAVDIGWIEVPRLGKTLDELENIQLSGFLESVDLKIDFDDWQDLSSDYI